VLFIFWRDTTSELWTPIQFPLYCYTVLVYSHCLLSCIILSYYHSIRSILCLQQTGEIDNLIISWEQSSWLCFVQVSRCYWGKTRQRAVLSGALVRSVTKLASITFLSLVLSPTGSIYLGFTTEGRLAAVLIIPYLGVPNWSVIYISTLHHQQVFWRRCRGGRRLLQGESRTHNLLLCLCFALLYFYTHYFIKNTKKFSFLYSCYFITRSSLCCSLSMFWRTSQ
jgi:hypothetical protein